MVMLRKMVVVLVKKVVVLVIVMRVVVMVRTIKIWTPLLGCQRVFVGPFAFSDRRHALPGFPLSLNPLNPL